MSDNKKITKAQTGKKSLKGSKKLAATMLMMKPIVPDGPE
jgi:hypothetical protein